jgi:hypothetical protein
MATHWGVTPPRHNEPDEPPSQPNSDSDSAPDDARCPECNAILINQNEATKHAITHYGERPIPVYGSTLLARQRQAMLLGRDIPKE